ncbi:MAG: LD-carboxypeptidase [Actinomycetota bacterium]|nr:LD-carboxypeptidase [Actinomycetota bacterium]
MLRPGDQIAVVAPGSPVLSRSRLAAGMQLLRDWGFRPVPMPHLDDVRGHLAGDDTARAADLDRAFRDPKLRAVWAARGGYGSARLLDRLDWEALRRDPKVLVGFSDVTALLAAAWRRLRLVTFHGPFVGQLGDLANDRLRASSLHRLLTDSSAILTLAQGAAGATTVTGGIAEGRLVGGNLALLCSLVGTPDQPDTDGAVLLLEDVHEPPYRLDRMLVQLRRAGLLQRAAGVTVAALRSCAPPADRPSASAQEVIVDLLGDLGVPVLHGLELGHTDGQLAVPLGVRVRLDASARRLTMLEVATAPAAG